QISQYLVRPTTRSPLLPARLRRNLRSHLPTHPFWVTRLVFKICIVVCFWNWNAKIVTFDSRSQFGMFHYFSLMHVKRVRSCSIRGNLFPSFWVNTLLSRH